MGISVNLLVIALAGVVGILGGVVVYCYRRRFGLAIAASVCLLILTAIALQWNSALEPDPEAATQWPTMANLRPTFPAEVPASGFLGSDACRDCHQDNHASWHASYHRTMTQVATPDAMMDSFNDETVTAMGARYRLHQHEDVCWAEITGLGNPAVSQTNVPIVMTTGSHHMQAYWFASGIGRMTSLLPIVYLRDTQEWVPRSHAFLRPETLHPEDETGRWNSVCSSCHSTHRRERTARATGVGHTGFRTRYFL